MKSSDLYRELRGKLREKQSANRFAHSVSVGDLAARLGKRHGWSPERARLAGLLHDYAKEWSPGELRRYVKKHRVAVPEFNFIWETSPNMLHAYVSAHIAQKKGWIKKKDALAIASHTLGHPTMGLEQKIIYIADMSAPGRSYPEARAVRRAAMTDLDRAFREALTFKLGWQVKKGKPVHPLPVLVWNRLVCKVKS